MNTPCHILRISLAISQNYPSDLSNILATLETPMQVREVAVEAIERARRGEGPTLIEAQTYRFRGHSLADPDELREKKEKEHWQVRFHLAFQMPALYKGVCCTHTQVLHPAQLLSPCTVREVKRLLDTGLTAHTVSATC